jgi:hypothetical protein
VQRPEARLCAADLADRVDCLIRSSHSGILGS